MEKKTKATKVTKVTKKELNPKERKKIAGGYSSWCKSFVMNTGYKMGMVGWDCWICAHFKVGANGKSCELGIV